MREHRMRKVWAAGGCVINFWIDTPSLEVVEAIAGMGYDSVLFDMQHSSLDFKDLVCAQAALGSSDIASLVRVPGLEPGLIMKLIDNGLEAVMCPNVDTPDQAAEFVGACRYPPAGYRSSGPSRRALRGLSQVEYFAAASDAIVTFAQIESLAALQNIEAICATPGLDAVFVGPVDLAISAGEAPAIDYTSPVVVRRHRQIINAARNAGVKVGMLATGREALETVLGWGVDFVSCGSDLELIVDGAEHVLSETRAILATLA